MNTTDTHLADRKARVPSNRRSRLFLAAMTALALVMLAAGVPVLLASGHLASRGSWRAVYFWFGSMFYLAYNAFLLLFLTPVNSLFLLYRATQALAVFSIFVLRDVTRRTREMN